MKLHWRVLIGLGLGLAAGALVQTFSDAPCWIGARVVDAPQGGVLVDAIVKNLLKDVREFEGQRLRAGDRLDEWVTERGVEGRERRAPLPDGAALEALLEASEPGTVVSLRLAERPATYRQVVLELHPESQRARWIVPFAFGADMFMRLLKLLIVPLVVTSIITGVAGLGGGQAFGRLGFKTLGYYVTTSFLAALLGLSLVTAVQPGHGAALGLSPSSAFGDRQHGLLDMLREMVPENIFHAFSDNGAMLQIIFFSILFGFFLGRLAPGVGAPVLAFFQGAFQVMMQMAVFVLKLVPIGVFLLMAKVVAETGFDVFRPLALFMITVFGGLLLHAAVVLPLILRWVGKVSPWRWFQAMSPALLTAFSTSSSSATLPVTLETLETRGRVSNRTSSFVAPLGATVNMDGTALYECMGVVFLAQYYASVGGHALTFTDIVTVVIASFFASVGAAGIPSAGLVLMLTILSTLQLPVEGAALLLAIDRPLDMCRTVVNVWSDSCGTAIIARSEGEHVAGSLVGGRGES